MKTEREDIWTQRNRWREACKEIKSLPASSNERGVRNRGVKKATVIRGAPHSLWLAIHTGGISTISFTGNPAYKALFGVRI